MVLSLSRRQNLNEPKEQLNDSTNLRNSILGLNVKKQTSTNKKSDNAAVKRALKTYLANCSSLARNSFTVVFFLPLFAEFFFFHSTKCLRVLLLLLVHCLSCS